jgi:hypothetical protein
MNGRFLSVPALALGLLLSPVDGRAQGDEVEVLATAAISLAGRTDIVIPPLGGDLSGFPLLRTDVAPGQTVETMPGLVLVTPDEILSFSVTGQCRFSPGGSFTGPDGDAPKDVLPVGGISGYVGVGGSLVAVFLDDAIPASDPPQDLDFSEAGPLGTHFISLEPELGQIFFVGDGRRGTGSGAFQSFTAPPGATRLFFGTMDSTGLGFAPGYYTDNSGAFMVTVPEPANALLALASALTLAALPRWRRGLR